ncbi:MAG: hypothetical protein DRO05_08370 [Thermoproteota archaeon]|nr:MAG: hypothetical protein DRO05_08370 [Candidatus Korarchaeota archaeon]
MYGLQERLNWPVACLFQAVLFGVSHIWSLGVIVFSLVFGLFLGVIVKYLGVGSSIAIHFSVNLVAHNLL